MKLGAEIVGDLVKDMRAELKAAERGAGAAMHKAGMKVKTDWREQIVSAGLGTRLSKTIRSQTFPANRESLNAASLVWSKAPHIISAHDEGALIKSTDGFFLAIPQPAAGKLRGGKSPTPYEWEQRTGLQLRLIYRRKGLSLLVADKARLDGQGLAKKSNAVKTGRNQVTAIVFVLVPQSRLRKRLDLQRAVKSIDGRLPGQIVREWDRRSSN